MGISVDVLLMLRKKSGVKGTEQKLGWSGVVLIVSMSVFAETRDNARAHKAVNDRARALCCQAHG